MFFVRRFTESRREELGYLILWVWRMTLKSQSAALSNAALIDMQLLGVMECAPERPPHIRLWRGRRRFGPSFTETSTHD